MSLAIMEPAPDVKDSPEKEKTQLLLMTAPVLKSTRRELRDIFPGTHEPKNIFGVEVDM